MFGVPTVSYSDLDFADKMIYQTNIQLLVQQWKQGKQLCVTQEENFFIDKGVAA
jgi:hypothetical protein